jgi:hypothetical protein
MAEFLYWQFVEVQSFKKSYWVWQRMTLDGLIFDRSKAEFADYGAAVRDAIAVGKFKPKFESWVIISAHGVTHFTPNNQGISSSEQTLKARTRAPRKVPAG